MKIKEEVIGRCEADIKTVDQETNKCRFNCWLKKFMRWEKKGMEIKRKRRVCLRGR